MGAVYACAGLLLGGSGLWELHRIRVALMRLAWPAQRVDDERDWHPAVPDVPHDGYRVAGVR